MKNKIWGKEKQCPCCGKKKVTTAKECSYCGEWLDPNTQRPKPNVFGILGFIFAIIALIIPHLIPVVLFALFGGWILWLLGFVFSIVGICRRRKGFAIAGLIISVIVFFALLNQYLEFVDAVNNVANEFENVVNEIDELFR